MNKTAFKIFLYFTITAGVIATILLCLNFLAFAFIGSDTSIRINNKSPQGLIEQISASIIQSDTGFTILDDTIIPPGYWVILIDENGSIKWSFNKPPDIPSHYTINDVAVMTRWFLNDYPVYVRTTNYGLLVLGMPKNSVGKYDMAYSRHWFDTLPQRLIAILIINICLALLMAFTFGFHLYRRLKKLMSGLEDMRREKRVNLKERGIFREISHSINRTSNSIERKNILLSSRDSARSNWINGIAHDIRTPLAVIMGFSSYLS